MSKSPDAASSKAVRGTSDPSFSSSSRAASRAARPSFFRGTGAVNVSQSERGICSTVSKLTSTILLDIKPPQKTDSLITSPATLNLVALLDIATISTAAREGYTERAASIWQLGWFWCRMSAGSLPVGAHWE